MLGGNKFRLRQGFAAQNACTPLSRRLACARWARVLLVLVRCHGDVQLVELLLCDLARRAHHDVLRVLVHRERN